MLLEKGPDTISGKKSRFSGGRPEGRLPRRRARDHTRVADQEQAARNALKKRRAARNRGFLVTSFSYLPATLTTLFFLAASLLLGYLQ
jgi:hypothetical protein